MSLKEMKIAAMVLALVAGVFHAALHLVPAEDGHFSQHAGTTCVIASIDSPDPPKLDLKPDATMAVCLATWSKSEILRPTVVTPWRARAPPATSV